MVLKVGANTRKVEDYGNPSGTENGRLCDSASLEDSWGVEDPCRNDDFRRGCDVEDGVVDQ